MLKKRVALVVAMISGLMSAATVASAAEYVPRKHSLNVASAFETTAQFAASFGGDWAEPAKYLDLIVVAPGALDRRIRAAGLRTLLYMDPNLCSGARGPGGNPYPRPDCSDWPATAFYTQDGQPERALTAHAGRIFQRVGDPSSKVWRERTEAAAGDALHESDFDLIQLDDAVTPDEYYAPLCWGYPALDPDSTACDGAPGGRAHAPWTAAYSRASWEAGERGLIESLQRPVVINGLAGYDHHGLPVAAGLAVSASNAWGAMCDACFFGNGAVPKNVYLWTGPLFETRLQGALDVTAAHKNVVVVDEATTDIAARRRALADIMLFYDPDLTWTWGAPCGERSRIHACPESALTFYEPYAAYPKHVADLEAPGGAYVREFKACYKGGEAVGPCAAVINPDPGVTHRFPRLRSVYGHTLEIAGDSLCACYGEHGSLSLTGAPPPDPLPPASGYVLFR